MFSSATYQLYNFTPVKHTIQFNLQQFNFKLKFKNALFSNQHLQHNVVKILTTFAMCIHRLEYEKANNLYGKVYSFLYCQAYGVVFHK